MGRQIGGETDTGGETDRPVVRDRWGDRHTDGETDSQTDGETDRW